MEKVHSSRFYCNFISYEYKLHVVSLCVECLSATSGMLFRDQAPDTAVSYARIIRSTYHTHAAYNSCLVDGWDIFRISLLIRVCMLLQFYCSYHTAVLFCGTINVTTSRDCIEVTLSCSRSHNSNVTQAQPQRSTYYNTLHPTIAYHTQGLPGCSCVLESWRASRGLLLPHIYTTPDRRPA